MTVEQRDQYLELQKLMQKERKAEQAKQRRTAKKWIEERYDMTVEQLDNLVDRYKKAQAEKRRKPAGVYGAQPIQRREHFDQDTPGGCIGSNTSERGDNYEQR